MSDEPATNVNADEPNQFDQEIGVDWLLAWIVSLAETGIEIGVTLSVGGQLVSGTVIGGRQYFDGISNSIKDSSASEGDASLPIRESLAESFKTWRVVYPTPGDVSLNGGHKPSFIHLKNVTIFMGTSPLPSNFWRGQLANIDGFSFGSLLAS